MGQNGGKRPGAGRKPGSTNRKTREIAERVAEASLAGIELSPLEVMLENMYHFRKVALDAEATLLAMSQQQLEGEAGEDPEDQFKYMMAKVKTTLGLRMSAQECAKDASPYIHPRLANVDIKATVSTHVAALAALDELMKDA